MNHFDYLGDPRRERISLLLHSLATGERRAALVAVLTVVASLAIALGAIAVRRIAIDADIARAERLRAANAPALVAFKRIARDVATLGALQQSIVAARSSAHRRARDIVRLSDGLPAGIWIAALHTGSDDWRINGEAKNLEQTAQALLAAQRDRGSRSVTLASANRTVSGDLVTYEIVIQRK